MMLYFDGPLTINWEYDLLSARMTAESRNAEGIKKVEWSSGYSENEIEVMDYVGIADENEKDIFEGDLIEVDGIVSQVIFREGVFCALPISVNAEKWIADDHFQDISFCHLKLNEWKVIGNIYQNADLLKV